MNTTQKLQAKFKLAAILRDGMRPARKKWKTTPLVAIPDAPGSFLDMQRKTGRKYNGSIAGRF